MELNIREGMSHEIEKIVTEKDTAVAFGNGKVSVLATPMLISWIEEAALNAVLPSLPEGCETVGVDITMKHLAATPVGMKVRVAVEITEVNGKIMKFTCKAYDEIDKIAEATHTRAVIDLKKFLAKANAKGKN